MILNGIIFIILKYAFNYNTDSLPQSRCHPEYQSRTSAVPAQTLNRILKFHTMTLISARSPQSGLNDYKKAPTKPATPIKKLPAPTTKPSAPLLAVLVEDAPVEVPLPEVLLAALTPPLESVA